jgi:NAD(P)-dependent dehydrogenase (short-subunit alcohol dehydrogenase family)
MGCLMRSRPKESERFEGRTAIVTGAASGMGKATAARFLAERASVVLLDLDAGGVESAAAELDPDGTRTLARRCDVTSAADADAAVAAAVERFGGVDCLVNCAGVASMAPFGELTEEQWDRTMDVNAKGVFLMMRAALPALRATGAGSVVNIASQSGKRGEAELAHYCASKAAVILLTRAAALELAPEVRVNSVCPGYVDTAMQDELAAAVAAETGTPLPELMTEWIQEVPMGRFQQADDIAKLVLFLASDDASEITGEDVNITGGLMMF